MSTATAPRTSTKCVSCQRKFRPRPRPGPPRRHCERCRPPRLKITTPKTRRGVSGEPFTVAHFRAWARGMTLDTGDPWEIEPFQAAFLADVFAGIEECWLIVPEGNAKSTLVSGLGLYHAEHRDDAFVPVAASARDQAGIIHRQASGLVRRSKAESRFKVQDGYRRILCAARRSVIQIYAADAGTGDGVIPTFALIDELHRHKSLELYRTWAGKLQKRRGQIVVISTAGEPGSEFEEARDRIRASATEIDVHPTFIRAAGPGIVMHEWAIPADGDVEDVALVKAANPLRAITIESLAQKRQRPTMTLPHWRRFTCNLPTRGDSAAIQEAEWLACRTDDEIPEGEPIGLGLDIAWKWDTTALVPLWMPEVRYRLLGPATVLEPPRDGSSLDPHLIEQAILDVHARNPLHTVVMDTSRAEQLASWIAEETGATVVDRGQSNTFAVNDYERWMEAMRLGWLRWAAPNAELTKHVLNAVTRLLPGGDTRFDRPREARRSADQDRRVIDALTAAGMVHATLAAEMTAEPEPAGSWVPL